MALSEAGSCTGKPLREGYSRGPLVEGILNRREHNELESHFRERNTVCIGVLKPHLISYSQQNYLKTLSEKSVEVPISCLPSNGLL